MTCPVGKQGYSMEIVPVSLPVLLFLIVTIALRLNVIGVQQMKLVWKQLELGLYPPAKTKTAVEQTANVSKAKWTTHAQLPNVVLSLLVENALRIIASGV